MQRHRCIPWKFCSPTLVRVGHGMYFEYLLCLFSPQMRVNRVTLNHAVRVLKPLKSDLILRQGGPVMQENKILDEYFQ